MSVSKNIEPGDLGKAIEQELTVYHASVLERVNEAGKAAIKALAQRTKATAPKQTGSYRRNIASKMLRKSRTGDETYVWYVKAPDYRLTHLLVHGHARAGGGPPVPGDPFLHNAVEAVLSEYEQTVEEAVKNA